MISDPVRLKIPTKPKKTREELSLLIRSLSDIIWEQLKLDEFIIIDIYNGALIHANKQIISKYIYEKTDSQSFNALKSGKTDRLANTKYVIKYLAIIHAIFQSLLNKNSIKNDDLIEFYQISRQIDTFFAENIQNYTKNYLFEYFEQINSEWMSNLERFKHKDRKNILNNFNFKKNIKNNFNFYIHLSKSTKIGFIISIIAMVLSINFNNIGVVFDFFSEKYDRISNKTKSEITSFIYENPEWLLLSEDESFKSKTTIEKIEKIWILIDEISTYSKFKEYQIILNELRSSVDESEKYYLYITYQKLLRVTNSKKHINIHTEWLVFRYRESKKDLNEIIKKNLLSGWNIGFALICINEYKIHKCSYERNKNNHTEFECLDRSFRGIVDSTNVFDEIDKLRYKDILFSQLLYVKNRKKFLLRRLKNKKEN